jgi:hypothetical protein
MWAKLLKTEYRAHNFFGDVGHKEQLASGNLVPERAVAGGGRTADPSPAEAGSG